MYEHSTNVTCDVCDFPLHGTSLLLSNASQRRKGMQRVCLQSSSSNPTPGKVCSPSRQCSPSRPPAQGPPRWSYPPGRTMCVSCILLIRYWPQLKSHSLIAKKKSFNLCDHSSLIAEFINNFLMPFKLIDFCVFNIIILNICLRSSRMS